MEEIEKKYKNDEKILLVTHGGVARAIDCYFNGLPEDGDVSNIKLIGNCEIKEYKEKQ